MLYNHHSPDYQCTDLRGNILPECEYRGQEILTRHRLGDDQEHQCWDKREDIREEDDNSESDNNRFLLTDSDSGEGNDNVATNHSHEVVSYI